MPHADVSQVSDSTETHGPCGPRITEPEAMKPYNAQRAIGVSFCVNEDVLSNATRTAVYGQGIRERVVQAVLS